MKKAYEFRIYPSLEQEKQFKKANGLCRLYWNTVLAQKKEAWEKKEKYSIGTINKTFEKTKPEVLEWAKEVDSTIFAAEWKIITSAFNNYFRAKSGKLVHYVGEPKFKSKKKDKISITFTSQNKPRILKNGYLFLTRKLGPIKGVFHRWVEGEMLHATIKQTKTGKWFVKICVDKKDEKKNKNGKIVGIDWNCRDEDFVVRSDGMKIKCPRYLQKSSKQLKHWQKIMSKRYAKGLQIQSSNYEKAKRKVALLHEHVSWQRKDFLHKESRKLCNEFQTVVCEDVNLQNMAENLNHGKVVGDQGFGMFRQMVSYKGDLQKVSPKNTSKTCHVCRYVNPKVKVGVNFWKCPVCSSEHDRDINAALNILSKYVTSRSIVGRELTENTNASGEPKCSMKEEILLTGVYNSRQQGGEAIVSLVQ